MGERFDYAGFLRDYPRRPGELTMGELVKSVWRHRQSDETFATTVRRIYGEPANHQPARAVKGER